MVHPLNSKKASSGVMRLFIINFNTNNFYNFYHYLKVKIFPNNGSMDVCGYTRIKNKNILGWLPRVVWEFSIDGGNREAQLFGYLNNLDKDYPEDYWPFYLGVTIIRSKSPMISLLGFYKVLQIVDDETVIPKMASFKLFEDSLTVESLAKVLHAIDYWMNIPDDCFSIPSNGKLPQENQRNLCRDLSQRIIYKVYDYRFHNTRKTQTDRNSYLLSQKYLPLFQLVINSPDI